MDEKSRAREIALILTVDDAFEVSDSFGLGKDKTAFGERTDVFIMSEIGANIAFSRFRFGS